MVHWSHHSPFNDCHRFYWLRASVGSNEFLGCNCHHQFSQRNPYCRRSNSHLVMGGGFQ